VKNIKYFIMGAILMLMLNISFISFGYITKKVELSFDSIIVKLNGNTISGTNILYSGTTYVPLRKIAEMLDKNVSYNSKTRTVNITNKTPKINSVMKEESIGFLKYGLLADSVTVKLGNPDFKSDNTEWGADGMYHQDWKYNKLGIEIGMFSETKNTIQTIYSIHITAPCNYKTNRDISIGSSLDDIETIYANNIVNENTYNNSIMVGSAYDSLIFEIDSKKNNTVKSIFLGAASE
jgi:hypothetical protein